MHDYPILKAFGDAFTFLMLLLLFLNLQQRKHKHSYVKRRALILLASMYLSAYIFLIVIEHFQLPPYLEFVVLAVAIILVIIFRKIYFPFRLKCSKCGKKMDFNQALSSDDNLCLDCHYEKYPDERPKEKEEKKVEVAENDFSNFDKVSMIDWDLWEAEERCTLLYLMDKENNRVLLIKKKRGMGKGLINGPGGHIELEETKYEAAIREMKEETGLTVSRDDLIDIGSLRFQFQDGLSMIGYVFIAYKYSGTLLEETDETEPVWTDISSLDYSKMWEDDVMWLPYALEGKKLEGYFIFSGEKMIDGKVDFVTDES